MRAQSRTARRARRPRRRLRASDARARVARRAAACRSPARTPDGARSPAAGRRRARPGSPPSRPRACTAIARAIRRCRARRYRARCRASSASRDQTRTSSSISRGSRGSVRPSMATRIGADRGKRRPGNRRTRRRIADRSAAPVLRAPMAFSSRTIRSIATRCDGAKSSSSGKRAEKRAQLRIAFRNAGQLVQDRLVDAQRREG